MKPVPKALSKANSETVRKDDAQSKMTSDLEDDSILGDSEGVKDGEFTFLKV